MWAYKDFDGLAISPALQPCFILKKQNEKDRPTSLLQWQYPERVNKHCLEPHSDKSASLWWTNSNLRVTYANIPGPLIEPKKKSC